MNQLTKRAIYNVESTEPQNDLMLSVVCGVVLAVLSVAFFL